MTDQTQTATPAPAEEPSSGPTSTASSGGFDPATFADDHPEVIVGGAFAGGFLLATILRRLAG